MPRRCTCRSALVTGISIRRSSESVDSRHREVCGSHLRSSCILSFVNGILGGTFDPPHFGHLAIAHAAYEQLGLDAVLLMVAGEPWQKTDDAPTSAEHRFAMTSIAASESDHLVADDREIHRTGPTYTIDTVESMDGPCVLILGADAAAGVPTWHRGSELLDMATFAVVPRPGIDVGAVEDALGDRFRWLDLPLIDLSSTAIRQHVAKGHSARYLVPEGVSSYIEVNSLYRTSATSVAPVPIIADDE